MKRNSIYAINKRDPDAIVYPDANGENTRLKLGAGCFCILFPGEAHAPSIRTGSVGANVRKIVLKIKA